jgi:hypothetical protein
LGIAFSAVVATVVGVVLFPDTIRFATVADVFWAGAGFGCAATSATGSVGSAGRSKDQGTGLTT